MPETVFDHDTLAEIEALASAAIPGPWGWRGYADGAIELRTLHSGGKRVITTLKGKECVVVLEQDDDLGIQRDEVALTAEACVSCRAMFGEWKDTGEAPEGYKCPEDESWGTLYLTDPDRRFVRAANVWAERERPYRQDVARVNHPDALYIARMDPTTTLALVEEIKRLRAEME